MLSPTGSGELMSRQELADEVNRYLQDRGDPDGPVTANQLGKLEQGVNTWPRALRREAYRAVLGVATDAELGFFNIRRRRKETVIAKESPQIPSLDAPSELVRGHEDVGTLARAVGRAERGVAVSVVSGLSASSRHPAVAEGSLWTGGTAVASGGRSGYSEEQTLVAAAGQFFDGLALEARVYPAVDDGRILAAVPAGYANDYFLRRPRRGLVVGLPAGPVPRAFGLDARQARRRLSRAADDARLAIPHAYVLDDLIFGILWAVSNLDEALLNDDGLLAELQQQLSEYETLPHSSAGRDIAADLTRVSQMWLGSEFCARHILRRLAVVDQVPDFWTREQRGEEASTWLLFRHKYDYLQAVADRFSGQQVSRAFCIPPQTVTESPRAERVLLLLAAALMESFEISVEVCTEPEYAAVEGFALERGRQAIVANWIGADGIWHVDVTADRPALRQYGDLTGHARAHSIVAGDSSLRRLRALADYLGLDWLWLVQRCAELGQHGCAGVAEPRSRLLSVAGLDRACQYVGEAAMVDG
ncbi:XRE family transcriptional regulator [Actinomycetes bacterium KLBMP 9797]